MGEHQRGVLRGRPAVEEGGLHAGHVQLGALRLATARPRHEGPVARADQLLQLGLGVAQRARGGVRRLRAELVRLVLRDARQAKPRALGEGGVERLRLHVEVVRVLVVEARGHVLPVVAQRRGELLLGRDRHERVLRHEVEQLAEAVHGQHLGHVRALRLLRRRGDLGELAVLRRQLGRRRDLHALGLLQRALREGGEPGEPLHLDVEQLAAHGALLGGRVDVEDVAADRELPAVLDLVDPLVAAGHEAGRRSRPGRAGRPSRSRSRAGGGRGRAPSRPAPRRRSRARPTGCRAGRRGRRSCSPTRCGGGARCDS